jgi:hypothetical protein
VFLSNTHPNQFTNAKRVGCCQQPKQYLPEATEPDAAPYEKVNNLTYQE